MDTDDHGLRLPMAHRVGSLLARFERRRIERKAAIRQGATDPI